MKGEREPIQSLINVYLNHRPPRIRAYGSIDFLVDDIHGKTLRDGDADGLVAVSCLLAHSLVKVT